MEKLYFELDDDFDLIIKNSLKDKEVIKTEQISTGWTNIVYEVETTDGNYFFRFPRDEFWSRTIVKDYEFSNYIYNKTDFKTSKLQLLYDNGRPFSMHKKIAGDTLANKADSLTDKEVEKVGNDIAKFMYQLHCLDFDKKEVFKKSDRIGTDLPDFLNELLVKHVSDDDRKFWNYPSKDKSKCLVHGDLNSSNVLLDENNNVTAIIDWGFGGFGNEYDDISRIIGRCPSKFKDAIIDSYEKYSNTTINREQLDNEIEKWNNIDSGYINYMRSIGIYE